MSRVFAVVADDILFVLFGLVFVLVIVLMFRSTSFGRFSLFLHGVYLGSVILFFVFQTILFFNKKMLTKVFYG